VVALILLSTVPQARERAMTPEQSTETPAAITRIVIDRLNQAFNRHDADALAPLLTDDTMFEDTSPAPDGRRIEGKTAVVAFWREWFTRNPDARLEAEDVIVTGDRAVVRWIYPSCVTDSPGTCAAWTSLPFARDGKVAAKLAYVKG
jgi:ketosteroid isomerase-like protein